MEKDFNVEINKRTINDVEVFQEASSNPLETSNIQYNDLSLYSKTTARPSYDSDIIQITEVVRIFNNVAPKRMPEYPFNADNINGERYYKPDGTLLYIRDFDNDVIRDYYYKPNTENSEYNIFQILEHDKNTGRLRVKIEPITKVGSCLRTNITIFDEKISNKYTIIQLADGGYVSNISEFTGNGKSFQTLFRNINTLKPARYIKGVDDKLSGFSMVDCTFSETGEVVRIKRYAGKREIVIDYTPTQKHITVKTK